MAPAVAEKSSTPNTAICTAWKADCESVCVAPATLLVVGVTPAGSRRVSMLCDSCYETLLHDGLKKDLPAGERHIWVVEL
jgi:hypothetical protein